MPEEKKKSIIISEAVHYDAKVRATSLRLNLKQYIERLIKADLKANPKQTATTTATTKNNDPQNVVSQ